MNRRAASLLLLCFAAPVPTACGTADDDSTSGRPDTTSNTTTSTTLNSTATADQPVATAAATAAGTTVDTLTAVQQAAVYEAALRYTYSRALPTLSPDDDTRGVLLVDHTVSAAGEQPLSFSATAEGEPFHPGVLGELSRRLSDLPLLGVVGSAREVIGPDHHPTLPQILRPGFLHVVSPIEVTSDGLRVGVELTYPGGQGWILHLDLTDSGAKVIDAQSPWIS